MRQTYCILCGAPNSNSLIDETYNQYLYLDNYFIPNCGISHRIKNHPFKNIKSRNRIINNSLKLDKSDCNWLKDEGFLILYSKVNLNFNRLDSAYLTSKVGFDNYDGNVIIKSLNGENVIETIYSCHYYKDNIINYEKFGFAMHKSCYELILKKLYNNINLNLLWDRCKILSLDKNKDFYLPLNLNYFEINDYISQLFWGPIPGDEWILYKPIIPILTFNKKEIKYLKYKNQKSNILSLPKEVILKILIKLIEPKSIINFSLSCKQSYNTYLRFENFIWYKLCPPILSEENKEILNLNKKDINYLDFYKKCYLNLNHKNSIRVSNVVHQLMKDL